jgi:hypothetical protein
MKKKWNRIDEKTVGMGGQSTALISRLYSHSGNEDWPRIALNIYRVSDKQYKFVCQTWDGKGGVGNKYFWHDCAVPNELIPDIIEMWKYVDTIKKG